MNVRSPIQYHRRHETTCTRFQIKGWFLIVPRPQCAFIWKSTRYKWVENNVFLCIGGRPKCSLKPNSRYIRARYTRICSHTNVHKLIGTLEMCSLWPSSCSNRARYNGSRLYSVQYSTSVRTGHAGLRKKDAIFTGNNSHTTHV